MLKTGDLDCLTSGDFIWPLMTSKDHWCIHHISYVTSKSLLSPHIKDYEECILKICKSFWRGVDTIIEKKKKRQPYCFVSIFLFGCLFF